MVQTVRPNLPRWHPLEALAGWLLPGLGHVMLGQRARGVIIGLTILSLYLGGLLIGGISVIDRREHFAWFFGQAIIAPTLALQWTHDRLDYGGKPNPFNDPAYVPSLGRPDEQGVLFTALAGLLNLLAIVDVIYCDPSASRRESAREKALALQAAGVAGAAGATGEGGNGSPSPTSSAPFADNRPTASRPLTSVAAFLPMLAWRPFLEPLPVDRFWLLLIVPMALAIAIVYKALRIDDLRQLPRKAAGLAAQIILYMALAALVVWTITAWA